MVTFQHTAPSPVHSFALTSNNKSLMSEDVYTEGTQAERTKCPVEPCEVVPQEEASALLPKKQERLRQRTQQPALAF